MKQLRQYVMVISITALLGWIGVSVYASLKTPEGAQELFNSPPLAVLWCLLAVLLLVGFAAWRNMIRRPGIGLMHVGALTILLAALWGSDQVIQWRNAYYDQNVITEGFVPFQPAMGTSGQSFGRPVYSMGDKPKQLGELPFTLRCNKAWTEYYPPKDEKGNELKHWQLYNVTYKPDPKDKTAFVEDKYQPIAWKRGEPAKLPITKNVDFIVGRYWTDESFENPMLVIADFWGQGQVKTIPAIAGKRLSWGDAKQSAKSSEAEKKEGSYLEFLGEVTAMHGMGHGASGKRLRFQIVNPNEKDPARKVRRSMVGSASDAINYAIKAKQYQMNVPLMFYLPQGPQRHGRLAPPVLLVGVARNDDKGPPITFGRWLAGREFDSQLQHDEPDVMAMSLGPLFESEEEFRQAGSPAIVLQRPAQMPKDYFADLSILDEDGKELLRKTIEVNDPLEYGGYSLTLHSMRNHGMFEAPQISVNAIPGLMVVYVGFGLLIGGAFLQMWLVPAWRFVRRRGRRGESPDEAAASKGGAA